MGLMTTVTFAQDWDVDSRTRVNMHGEDGMMLTEQRATIGATWGGTDWGIHVSSDVNYALGGWDMGGTDPGVLTAKVYEAYASTDLMGYANLTVGRQALDFGSGALISSNQWGTRTTHDGMVFGIGAVEFADITLGYASMNLGYADVADGGLGESKGTDLFLNASKADGDWSANLLYLKSTATVLGTEMADNTAMGIDLSYGLMGGDLSLDVSYNTNATDGYDDLDEDMMSLGATYNVSEDISITANQTTYGDNGFDMVGTNMDGSWLATGGMGYLSANDEARSIGMNYTMGDFTLGATMHQVSNDTYVWVDVLTGEETEYDRSVMDISVAYTMSDNASLSLKYANDKGAWDTMDSDSDNKFMWVTLNIRP
jgi:hypothetical protein